MISSSQKNMTNTFKSGSRQEVSSKEQNSVLTCARRTGHGRLSAGRWPAGRSSDYQGLTCPRQSMSCTPSPVG